MGGSVKYYLVETKAYFKTQRVIEIEDDEILLSQACDWEKADPVTHDFLWEDFVDIKQINLADARRFCKTFGEDGI